MSEQTSVTSPTRGLSLWWKSFKQREKESESVSATQVSKELSSHARKQQSRRGVGAKRPQLNRSAVSSQAVPGISPGSKATTSSRNSVVYNQGLEVLIPRQYEKSPIFSAPLEEGLKYASVKISLTDKNGDNFVYGEVPVVIAKCSVYLKQHARDVEGIFRVPGSSKRTKVLQELFDTPPRFGKDLNWDGFNAHDVANVLRRYLNNLPEPIIPLTFYDKFRAPLREFPDITDYINHQAVVMHPVPNNEPISTNQVANESDDKSASAESPAQSATQSPAQPKLSRVQEATRIYEELIFQLPPASMQLLVYLLDLLSVFAAAANETKMTAANLAATFQTAILSHPDHEMSPEELQQSRLVIEFLIVNAGSILRKVQEQALRKHETEKHLSKRTTNPIPENGLHTQLNIDSQTSSDPETKARAGTEPDGYSNGMEELPRTLHIPTLTVQPSPIQRPIPLNDKDGISEVLLGSGQGYQGHRRRHSKSLSSAYPHPTLSSPMARHPSISSNTSDASGGSRRSNVFPQLRLQKTFSKSRQATPDSTPSEEKDTSNLLEPISSNSNESRRSRWRRSLLVLLPHSGDENGSPNRNPSPSKSWFNRQSTPINLDDAARDSKDVVKETTNEVNC